MAPAPTRTTISSDALDVPYGAGERSTFEVKFGAVRVGSGSLEVVGVENVRGRDAWHIAFNVQGGTFFYRVNDVYESWIDTRTGNSLLFNRQIEEGTRERTQSYEIMPERGTYVERTRQKITTRNLGVHKMNWDDVDSIVRTSRHPVNRAALRFVADKATHDPAHK